MSLSARDILAATDPKVIFGDDPVHAFRAFAKEWHPDHCKDPKAQAVFDHLLKLRDAAVRGGKLASVASESVAIPGGTLRYDADEIVLASASGGCDVAARCIEALGKAWPDAARRVPTVIAGDGDALTLKRPPGAVPMTAVMRKYPGGVPQEHVAWIVSRLFELVRGTAVLGKVSCGGLVPESMVVLVEPHGVIPLDWRFATPIGSRLVQLPAALAPLVPKDRKATAALDLASVHRAAIVLLGDPSGIGNALLLKAKREPSQLSPVLLDWFRAAPGTDPVVHYTNYRRILGEVFGEPKYVALHL